MPDALDVSQYELPAEALIDAVDLASAAGGRSELLVRLRDRMEKSHQMQKEWSSRFERLYDEALRSDFDPPFLDRWADALLEKERAALEQLRPLIDTLQQKISENGAQIDAEVQNLFEASIDSASAWIKPYRTLRTRLVKLACDRRLAASEILRAHPLEGDIDHEELTREIVARFPKILAALAK